MVILQSYKSKSLFSCLSVCLSVTVCFGASGYFRNDITRKWITSDTCPVKQLELKSYNLINPYLVDWKSMNHLKLSMSTIYMDLRKFADTFGGIPLFTILIVYFFHNNSRTVFQRYLLVLCIMALVIDLYLSFFYNQDPVLKY